MTEDERRRSFAEAFIAQARSDWGVYRILAERTDSVAVCHERHYLQMVCEKLAKAYRLRDTKAPVDKLVKSHTGFAKFVGSFAFEIRDEYRGRDAQLRGLIGRARALAREIEKLAPAIDSASVPENAEYPWERDGRVIAPCHYSFPTLDLLRHPGGRAFLNLVERALHRFEPWVSSGEPGAS